MAQTVKTKVPHAGHHTSLNNILEDIKIELGLLEAINENKSKLPAFTLYAQDLAGALYNHGYREADVDHSLTTDVLEAYMTHKILPTPAMRKYTDSALKEE